MNTKLLCWFLSGALTASVGLNLTRSQPAAAPAAGLAADCSLLDELALSPEQRQLLADCCARCCTDENSLAGDETTILQSLRRELASDDWQAQRVRELVAELDGLRSRRLRLATDAAVELRKVLRPDQLASLRQHTDCEITECGTK